MKRKLTEIYVRELFQPSILGFFTNPYFFARRQLFLAMKEFGPELKGKLLDVGCGSKPYKKLCAASDYIGMEIDTPENRASKNAEIFYDGKNFPFPDASFDSVLLNQVLEHVFEPAQMLQEIHRVLKPGGTLLITVPFIWDEHEQPIDYARYTSFGLKYLLEKHGFRVKNLIKLNPGMLAAAQLFSAQIFKRISTTNNLCNLFLTATIIAPMHGVLLLLSLILRGTKDIYLDNFALCEKR